MVLPAFRHAFSMKAIWYSCVVGVLLFASTGCLKKSEPFLLKDVSEAPAHLKKQRLEFQAVIHPDLSGRYEWRTKSGSVNKTGGGVSKPMCKYVIPVTERGWKKSDPVTLWITFASFKRDVSREIRGIQAALDRGAVVGVHRDFPSRDTGALRGVSAWQKAVADAETRHGIKSDPRAPIVAWVP